MKSLLVMSITFLSYFVVAQTPRLPKELSKAKLNKHENSNFYYSTSGKQLADSLYDIFKKQLTYFENTYKISPGDITVAILDAKDFKKIKELKRYNYPTWFKKKYRNESSQDSNKWVGQTIVISSQTEGDYRNYFFSLKDKAIQLDKKNIIQKLGGYEKCVDLNFMLILFHELGHFYQDQLKIEENGEWSNEFFANLFAYAGMSETHQDYADLWELFARVIVNEFKGNYKNLEEVNTIAKSDPRARFFLQGLLYHTAVQYYQKDDKLLSKLASDQRFQRSNDWKTQMTLLEEYMPGFSKIESLASE